MDFFTKYASIIAEEVNVKQVDALDIESVSYRKLYKPIGSKLKSFGSDAGKVIAAGKKGQVQQMDNWSIVVTDADQTWTLTSDQYEIEYQGIDTNVVNIDGDMIVKLDTQINQDLEQEWLIREICRLLNQMRKDADYQIIQRVACTIVCQNQDLLDIVERYESDVMAEALLDRIEYTTNTTPSTHATMLEYHDSVLYFTLYV